MAHTITMRGALIHLFNTDFKCPKCEKPHTEDDYYLRLQKSKSPVFYMRCKGCKTRLGITIDMVGDIHVWLKEDEKIPN